ncbi:MAG: hypothetical protein ACR2JH_09840 [Solirubrobacteraceae bacterium]
MSARSLHDKIHGVAELAGATPLDFLGRRIPGGGIIGDQIPKIQDVISPST